MQFLDSLLTCSCISDETPRMVSKQGSSKSLLSSEARESRISASIPYSASQSGTVVSTSFRAAQYINHPQQNTSLLSPNVDFDSVRKQMGQTDLCKSQSLRVPKVLEVVKPGDGHYVHSVDKSMYSSGPHQQNHGIPTSVKLNVNHPATFTVSLPFLLLMPLFVVICRVGLCLSSCFTPRFPPCMLILLSAWTGRGLVNVGDWIHTVTRLLGPTPLPPHVTHLWRRLGRRLSSPGPFRHGPIQVFAPRSRANHSMVQPPGPQVPWKLQRRGSPGPAASLSSRRRDHHRRAHPALGLATVICALTSRGTVRGATVQAVAAPLRALHKH